LQLQEQQRAQKAKERDEKQPAKKGGAQDAGKKKEGGASGNSKGASSSGNGGAGKSKGQQGSAQAGTSTTAAGDSSLQGHHYAQTSAANAGPSPLSMFLHLDPPKSAKSLNAKIHKEQIHPSVLRLALQYAEFKVVGANARCIAMLEAFKDVSARFLGFLFENLT
jgi:translation initiation factor eIF-2B subunit delta